MQKRTERALLACYLGGFLAVVLYLVFTQPYLNTPPLFANPPDEHARFLIPRFICDNGHLPTGFEEAVRVPGGLNGSYAFQPILPYIIMGYLMRLFTLFSADEAFLVIVARMVNVFSGTMMALVLYALARRIFDKPSYRWLFCFGVMYLPQHLFLHSYVNTESMCMLSITLMVYALVRLYQDGPDQKNHALLAAGASLCIQTYYNAYGYLLSAVILYTLYFARKDASGKRFFLWRDFIRHGVPVLVFVAVSAGWWFVREAVLLDGDFSGVRTNNAMREGIVVSPKERGIGFAELFLTYPVIRRLIESSIACYGSMSIFASPSFYFMYELYLGAGLAAFVIGIITGKRNDKTKVRFFCALFAAVLITVLLWVYYVYWIDLQSQGRYILPVLLPVYYCVCRGYAFLAGHCRARYAEQMMVTVLILFVAVTLCHYVFKLCRTVYLYI